MFDVLDLPPKGHAVVCVGDLQKKLRIITSLESLRSTLFAPFRAVSPPSPAVHRIRGNTRGTIFNHVFIYSFCEKQFVG